jgi:hypothetical protein
VPSGTVFGATSHSVFRGGVHAGSHFCTLEADGLPLPDANVFGGQRAELAMPMATRPWPPSTLSRHCRPRPAALAAAQLSVAAARVGRGAPLARGSGCECCCFRRADFLVLPNSISTAAALIAVRLWFHLLDIFVNAFGSLLTAAESGGMWHSITLAAAHLASCCGGPVGGSFASGFLLLEFTVEKRCDRERSNDTPVCVSESEGQSE